MVAWLFFSISKEESPVSGKLGPRLWLYPLWLLALSGLVLLGLWQLDRAEQKRAWQAEQQQPGLISPTAADIEQAMEGHHWIKAEMQVRWPDVRPLYLDNRTNQGQAGYELLLPVQLEDGSFIAANLGWLAMPERRDIEPVTGRPDTDLVSGVLGLPRPVAPRGAHDRPLHPRSSRSSAQVPPCTAICSGTPKCAFHRRPGSSNHCLVVSECSSVSSGSFANTADDY